MRLAHPIWILEGGIETGPFTLEDVEGRIRLGEVTWGTLSAIEGMPTWRPLDETTVWAQSLLLHPHLDLFEALVQRGKEGKNRAELRCELGEAIWGRSNLPPFEHRTGIERLLAVNIDLRCGQRQLRDRMDKDALLVFPAMELIRTRTDESFRDWEKDWERAGGRRYDGRMIAAINDEVWYALSDFGVPFPPFGVDLSMGTRGVNRRECEKLRVPKGPAIPPRGYGILEPRLVAIV